MITDTITWDYIELNDYFSKWLENDGHKVMDCPATDSYPKCPMDRMLRDAWEWIFCSSFSKHSKRFERYHNRLSEEEYLQRCKTFFDYHIYMAWISIRLLLNNGFKRVSYHEVSVLYAEHYKTVVKAFDRKFKHKDAGSFDLKQQLLKLMSTADMFQRKWNIYTGIKPNMLPSIVIGEYNESMEDYYVEDDDSEYVDIDDYIETDSDFFDDDTWNQVGEPDIDIVHWDTDDVFNFLRDILNGYCDDYRLQHPTTCVDITDDPVKGMIYDISSWLIKKRYEKYHVFRIAYVAEKLMLNAFRCVPIRDIEQDFEDFPEYMELCFPTWSNDPANKKNINKIYMTIVQFQHKWSYLKDFMPLQIHGLDDRDDPAFWEERFPNYMRYLNDSDCELTWSDVEEEAKEHDAYWDAIKDEEETLEEMHEDRVADINHIIDEINEHNEIACDNATRYWNACLELGRKIQNQPRRQTIFHDEI